VSSLAWEAQLMAGRAAIARQRPDEALGYFTNLTSDLRCPTNIHAQALFAYGDTLLSIADTGAVAAPINYREAVKVFSKLQSLYPELPVALLALGRMGDCYFQLGVLDTNNASANYSLATNAYQQVVAATLADESSRSQAEVGLGLVLERQAALAAVTNQPVLLNGALDHYLNVVFASSERTDPKWVKKAGLEALRLTETVGAWLQMVKLCDLLAEKLPSEQSWLARKKARAEEQIRQGAN
jgi:tetratricopeptide (TPR) repeat protein